MAVRLLLLPAAIAHPDRLLRPDSLDYLRCAAGLSAGHGLSQSTGPPFTPDTLHTPAYPLLLSLLRFLFGQRLWLVSLFQVLLSGLTCGLICLLGTRLLSERAARFGALLFAFSLGSVLYSYFILTETLFTLLLLGTLACLVAARDSASGARMHLWCAATGLLGGLAMLCRPIAEFFPVVLIPLAAALGWQRSLGAGRRSLGAEQVSRQRSPMRRIGPLGPGRTLLPVLLLLAGAFLIAVPWMLRNRPLLGTPALSSSASYNLLFVHAAALEADRTGRSPEEVRREMAGRADMELARRGSDTPAARTSLYNRWGRETILRHPFRYCIVQVRGSLVGLLPNGTEVLEFLGLTSGLKGTLGVLQQQGLLAGVRTYFGGRAWLLWLLGPFVILLGLVYVGAAAGMVALFRRRAWWTLALLVLPVLYFLLLPGAGSHPRFRVPVMPYLCLLAGAGLLELRRCLARIGKAQS